MRLFSSKPLSLHRPVQHILITCTHKEEVGPAACFRKGSQESLVEVAGSGMVLEAGCKEGCIVNVKAGPWALAGPLPQQAHRARGLLCEMGLLGQLWW